MPRTPKPPGQRRRRNTGQAQWHQLPERGREDAAPPLPEDEWLSTTVEWWKTLWSSPMATLWVEADIDPLIRLARLKDDFDRGERSGLTAIQNLEDRYGLSPKARRQLQWEIKQAEGASEVKPTAARHLQAVES